MEKLIYQPLDILRLTGYVRYYTHIVSTNTIDLTTYRFTKISFYKNLKDLN